MVTMVWGNEVRKKLNQRMIKENLGLNNPSFQHSIAPGLQCFLL
jgi:hypothetical protein